MWLHLTPLLPLLPLLPRNGLCGGPGAGQAGHSCPVVPGQYGGQLGGVHVEQGHLFEWGRVAAQ